MKKKDYRVRVVGLDHSEKNCLLDQIKIPLFCDGFSLMCDPILRIVLVQSNYSPRGHLIPLCCLGPGGEITSGKTSVEMLPFTVYAQEGLPLVLSNTLLL